MIGIVVGSSTAIDQTPPARAVRRRPPRRGWRDRIWTVLVRVTDWFLRRYYRVREFTEDPDCLIRVGHTHATRRIDLSDGTTLSPGDPVIDLHMWNEQLPRFFGGSADFSWATLIRRNLRHSIRQLARHLADHPDCQSIVAVRACVTFGSRRRQAQMRRAAAQFGFELVEGGPPNGLHEMGEDILIWAFARAFNPAALRRHKLRRDRTELWISRDRILQLYR